MGPTALAREPWCWGTTDASKHSMLVNAGGRRRDLPVPLHHSSINTREIGQAPKLSPYNYVRLQRGERRQWLLCTCDVQEGLPQAGHLGVYHCQLYDDPGHRVPRSAREKSARRRPRQLQVRSKAQRSPARPKPQEAFTGPPEPSDGGELPAQDWLAALDAVSTADAP